MKIVSSAQPVRVISAEVPSAGSTTEPQLVPGISAVVMATEKDMGDQGNEATKPRWIASSMRRVRWLRISASGSSWAAAVARLPSSAMAP
ncbi:hypothetical protein [Alloyangia mangrovi]|uniref:hypothetical protein n=1 Tax=Alloyangia mangrovi TaxID=1779329 RepID=UPI002888FCD5|nr:hypothetical protein [Alloyangia mangrovi]